MRDVPIIVGIPVGSAALGRRDTITGPRVTGFPKGTALARLCPRGAKLVCHAVLAGERAVAVLSSDAGHTGTCAVAQRGGGGRGGMEWL